MKQILFVIGLLSAVFVGCAKDNIIITDEPGREPTTIATTDTISVVFSTSGDATVTGASSRQTVTIEGNGVTIVNNDREAITYQLTGATENGYLKIYSDKKQVVELDGVRITNPNGAAINVQGAPETPAKGKAVYLVLNGSNALADGTSYSNTPSTEDEKAALFSEGQIIISGRGRLTVTAKYGEITKTHPQTGKVVERETKAGETIVVI